MRFDQWFRCITICNTCFELGILFLSSFLLLHQIILSCILGFQNWSWFDRRWIIDEDMSNILIWSVDVEEVEEEE